MHRTALGLKDSRIVTDDDLRVLCELLPAEDQIWLCVVYGSAAHGALGPNSDIDVLGEGEPAHLDAWWQQGELAIGREVNISGVSYMLAQPMMAAQILDGPVVLRDSRNRLEDMRREMDQNGRLRAFQVRILGEALDEFPQKGPARPFTSSEQRFMEALAGLRSERKRLYIDVSPLQRQWAVERMTRAAYATCSAIGPYTVTMPSHAARSKVSAVC